jgi:hypothetical protein
VPYDHYYLSGDSSDNQINNFDSTYDIDSNGQELLPHHSEEKSEIHDINKNSYSNPSQDPLSLTSQTDPKLSFQNIIIPNIPPDKCTNGSSKNYSTYFLNLIYYFVMKF